MVLEAITKFQIFLQKVAHFYSKTGIHLPLLLAIEGNKIELYCPLENNATWPIERHNLAHELWNQNYSLLLHLRPYLDDIEKCQDKTNIKTDDKVK